METMQAVECGACGWTGRRKTGNVVVCPKCGAIAGFNVPLTRLLLHLALHVPYVPFRPWILGLAIGRMPRKVGTSDAGNDSLKRALERGR